MLFLYTNIEKKRKQKGSLEGYLCIYISREKQKRYFRLINTTYLRDSFLCFLVGGLIRRDAGCLEV